MKIMSILPLPSPTGYRLWPLLCKPWFWSQWWQDVLFVHWPVSPAFLRPHLPRELEIDTWEGAGWVSAVFFHMRRVRPRWLPPVRVVSNFAELNFRTYVRRADKPGVYFLS